MFLHVYEYLRLYCISKKNSYLNVYFLFQNSCSSLYNGVVPTGGGLLEKKFSLKLMRYHVETMRVDVIM